METTHPPEALTLDGRVLRLERIVDGVVGEDQPGLRQRVRELEKLGKDVRELIFALRIVIIMAGLWLAGNIPGFITWLAGLFVPGGG